MACIPLRGINHVVQQVVGRRVVQHTAVRPDAALLPTALGLHRHFTALPRRVHNDLDVLRVVE